MSDFTHVYLITGFLGSGKTTFLNRIIKQFPKDKKLTLLVNEFGEVGVDGTLVRWRSARVPFFACALKPIL